MADDRQNFQQWYVEPLALLYPHRNAGILVFSSSLALLERYLRGKNGLTPKQDVDARCWNTLAAMFPVLRSRPDAAYEFWSVFRNGFLHQATTSPETRKGRVLPRGALTHDITQAVVIEPGGGSVVHPELFCREVLSTIDRDFAAYAGVGTAAPPLPFVTALVAPATGGTAVPAVVLSTSGR
jgi:hypothetical protein